MLAVRLLAHTAESVAPYDTLETFTLGSTHYFHLFTFGKNVDSDGFTNILVNFAIADFLYETFGSVLRFGEMINL